MKSFKTPAKRKPKKVVANPRVARTRNGGTQTQAEHMGKIRSALRNLSRFWRPIQAVRKRNKVGTGRSAKYYCEGCGGLFASVQVDHKVEAGSLRTYADLPAFCERLFAEDLDAYQCLCDKCHIAKTHPSSIPVVSSNGGG
jgi:hypothetical protein